jgi:hypothetical protein
MTATELRKKIKKQIDRVPAQRLQSAADYLAFLTQETSKATGPRAKFLQRLQKAEADIAAGRLIEWRGIRDDV